MKESSHVLDCNGREIFVGDRVRIIGEEVAIFLYCDERKAANT